MDISTVEGRLMITCRSGRGFHTSMTALQIRRANSISVPVKDNSAEATAAAASEAVRRLAGELAAGNHRP